MSNKKIILCNDAKELAFWNSIMKSEIAAGTHIVKLRNADEGILEEDGFPSKVTLYRAGFMTAEQAGLLNDPQTTEENKDKASEGYIYDAISGQWH